MADQAMLVDRRSERIGQRALLEQLDLMALARQSPRGAEAHHAAADNDRFHRGRHSAWGLVTSSVPGLCLGSAGLVALDVAVSLLIVCAHAESKDLPKRKSCALM